MSLEHEKGRPGEKAALNNLNDTTSVAPAIRVTPTKTTRDILVCCPLCGGLHHHGWPYGADEVGHRLAHCGRGEYLVEVVAP